MSSAIYSPTADILTICICYVFWMLLYSSYTIREQKLNIFNICNALLMLSCCCRVLCYMLIEKGYTGYSPLILVTYNVAYLLLLLIYYFFYLYTRVVFGIKETERTVADTVMLGGLIFWTVLIFLSPITGIGAQLQANGIITTSRFTPFMGGYVYFALADLYILHRHNRKLSKKIYYCIIQSVGVSFVLAIIQQMFDQVSFTCATFAFPIMAALFLFHYNAFDVATGSMDSKTFSSFITNIRGKDYGILCLEVDDVNPRKNAQLCGKFLEYAEYYFNNFVTFKMTDNFYIVCFKRSIQEPMDRINAFANTIMGTYPDFMVDYKLLFLQTTSDFRSSEDYMSYINMLMKKSSKNTFTEAGEKEMENYKRQNYIIEQLKDIDRRCDLNDERIMAYAQPILDVRTNQYSTAEILMRLSLPEIGMVFPDQFIHIAEEHEYIHSLSLIILNKACMAVRSLEEKGCKITRVSVNFSVNELRSREFCDDVLRIIDSNRVPYSKIAIELTESTNDSDYDIIKSVIENLKATGMKFYMDDFGTGYSNFERIMGLPLDTIKFDRSLTIFSGTDERNAVAIGELAKVFSNMNFKVLYEGVENEDDEMRCVAMHADYLQGYKYTRPIPVAQLENYFSKRA